MGSMEWSLTAYIYTCVGEMCLGVCALRVLLWKDAVLFCICVSMCVSLGFVGMCLQFHVYDYVCL